MIRINGRIFKYLLLSVVVTFIVFISSKYYKNIDNNLFPAISSSSTRASENKITKFTPENPISHTIYQRRNYLEQRLNYQTPDKETLQLFPKSGKYFPPTIEDLKETFEDRVSEDGSFFYPDIIKTQMYSSVAIIIPYRQESNQQLRYFMTYNIPILQKQNIKFKIYVIEQTEEGEFNRGRLNNAGFKIAMSDSENYGFKWDCVIVHDIDLLIMHEGNLYTCKSEVRHHSIHLSSTSGVISMTPNTWEKVNGYSL